MPFVFRSTTHSAALGLLLLLLVVPGCKDASDGFDESDVIAYYCLDCKEKFYTADKVFAEHCPAKKHDNIKEVLGYVYEDGTVALGTQQLGILFGGSPKKRVKTDKLPREQDLLPHGFKKATADQVLKRPSKN